MRKDNRKETKGISTRNEDGEESEEVLQEGGQRVRREKNRKEYSRKRRTTKEKRREKN